MRVLQGVPHDDRLLAQSLCARRAHVLLTKDIQETRADLAQIHREAHARERYRWKHEAAKALAGVRRERHVTAWREDVAGYDVREQQDEHDAEKKLGTNTQ